MKNIFNFFSLLKRYDDNGFDKNGLHKNGTTFDDNGYDRNGFNKEGYDKNGFNKNGYDHYGYDRSGYDKNGYNHYGYDRSGYDKNGYDKKGFNKEGYNRSGYDKKGFNRQGRDKNGFHKFGEREIYDKNGLLNNSKLLLIDVSSNGWSRWGYYDEFHIDMDGYNSDNNQKPSMKEYIRTRKSDALCSKISYGKCPYYKYSLSNNEYKALKGLNCKDCLNSQYYDTW